MRPFSSAPHHRYDVMIVGARVAGAATALLLARRGLRVLAVDRAREGTDTTSTHALMRTGVVQLARWGVLDAVVASGAPQIRRTVFHYGAEPVSIDIAPDRFAGGLYAPRRAVLDQLLVDAARRAGAEIRHGTRLVTLTSDRFGRVDGAVVDDGTLRTVRAELVVGADGADSAVAAQVRPTTYWHGRGGWTSTIYAYAEGLERDTSHWHFGAGATSGVIPTNDGQACVFTATSADRFREVARADVTGAWWDMLRDVSPGVAERLTPDMIGRRRSFPGRRPFARRCHGPGWALVGDAGWYDDPATAHGISAALRDAELLADGLVAGDLETYARRRDELASPITAVTDRIASLAWEHDRLRALHLDLSRAMKHEAQTVAAWPVEQTTGQAIGPPTEREGAA